MELQRTDYLFGDLDPIAVAAAYSCGHCHSATELRTVDGVVRVVAHHDDGCPVLNCVLPSAPDVVRAITNAVPDTFRP